ncbi:HPr-rel-A system PqqD family peptide chaperone [Novosphingopyxis baekryungensis]|uniref:HPr-rel-A system PqqD family peptide chaperone n=1 Tax=Novosphingopyxis baekryungensis TaxID=279369 RepID=UPI0003B63A9A|nr:HPr-rel-A system PqqD family peptide chaperone [Novosphingopyxis baekryungensis]
MPHDPLYIRVPESELVWHPLDAVTLVYHRRSGQTHIVMEPVPQILSVMQDRAMDAPAIAARLAEDYELPQTDAAAIIGARLEELAALGLAERVSPGQADGAEGGP